jgi:hypothetical protein
VDPWARAGVILVLRPNRERRVVRRKERDGMLRLVRRCFVGLAGVEIFASRFEKRDVTKVAIVEI